jgi:hypothetical protein
MLLGENTPFEDRAAIFLRASELITGKYRSEIVAATMLGHLVPVSIELDPRLLGEQCPCFLDVVAEEIGGLGSVLPSSFEPPSSSPANTAQK